MADRLPGGVSLHDGETTTALLYPSKLWFAPLYLVTLGLWEFWRRRPSSP